jgi:hypothetical protein
MFLQMAPVPAAGPAADTQSLRYVRLIRLPADSSGGLACAVLDTAALAHSASRSGDDLRVFAQRTGGESPDQAGWVETPFLLTESEAAPGDAEPAPVENLELRDGVIGFDLAMPRRAYTTVNLHLAAKNFVGTASVWGMNAPEPASAAAEPPQGQQKLAAGASGTAIGAFVIFDLSGEHLARWTSLPLQEFQFTMLHVELRLRSPQGRALPGLSTAMVQGADVPPSREAQTLYTQVVSSQAIYQQGTWTVTRVRVPAHVPIERLSFVLDPQFTRSFRRDVTVVAMPVAGDDESAPQSNISAAEDVEGEIWRVVRAGGRGGQPPIHQSRLSMDAVLASNLRSPAVITVAVKNGGDAALPLNEVKLEMRQRKVCFQAVPGNLYTLRYGDAALDAPSYAFAGSPGFPGFGQSSATPIEGQLGPEWVNPSYVARRAIRPYSERHPELLWMGLLASTTLMGVVGGEALKRRD